MSDCATTTASTTIVGIDEAGYGPYVGPLCVGMAVFAVPQSNGGGSVDGDGGSDGAPSRFPGCVEPNLWAMLRPTVARRASGKSRAAVFVNDSKQLKLSNALKTRHPLIHLERGVLAFARCAGLQAECDHSLLIALGASLEAAAWYDGPASPLPTATAADVQRLIDIRIAGACARKNVRPLELRCLTASEPVFNARLHDLGDKASVSFSLVGQLLSRVWRSQAAVDDGRPQWQPPLVIIDRQGGRMRYCEPLAAALPGAAIQIIAESPLESIYEITSHPAAPDAARALHIRFRVDADASCFCVALASMTAKLVRELAMARLNRYWRQRIVDLKPTAGYGPDGRRWLRDLAKCLPPQEVEPLRRRA